MRPCWRAGGAPILDRITPPLHLLTSQQEPWTWRRQRAHACRWETVWLRRVWPSALETVPETHLLPARWEGGCSQWGYACPAGGTGPPPLTPLLLPLRFLGQALEKPRWKRRGDFCPSLLPQAPLPDATDPDQGSEEKKNSELGILTYGQVS